MESSLWYHLSIFNFPNSFTLWPFAVCWPLDFTRTCVAVDFAPPCTFFSFSSCSPGFYPLYFFLLAFYTVHPNTILPLRGPAVYLQIRIFHGTLLLFNTAITLDSSLPLFFTPSRSQVIKCWKCDVWVKALFIGSWKQHRNLPVRLPLFSPHLQLTLHNSSLQ